MIALEGKYVWIPCLDPVISAPVCLCQLPACLGGDGTLNVWHTPLSLQSLYQPTFFPEPLEGSERTPHIHCIPIADVLYCTQSKQSGGCESGVTHHRSRNTMFGLSIHLFVPLAWIATYCTSDPPTPSQCEFQPPGERLIRTLMTYKQQMRQAPGLQ